MSKSKSSLIYPLCYTSAVAIAVVVSLVVTGSWQAGLPVGMLVGIVLGYFVDRLVRSRSGRNTMPGQASTPLPTEL